MSEKFPKDLKFLVKKYVKVLEFWKVFLNKVTKHKKNYMKGLNSKYKNKNIKSGGSP